MTITRLDRVRNMFRGENWSKTDEKVLFDIFFDNIDQLKSMLHDPVIFNSVWELFPGAMKLILGRDCSPKDAASKVDLLRTEYEAFVNFSKRPGVLVSEKQGSVSVLKEYWDTIGKESEIDRYFRLSGFPRYADCKKFFTDCNAAKIAPPDGNDDDRPGEAAGQQDVNQNRHNVD